MFARMIIEFNTNASAWQAHQTSASLSSHSDSYLAHASYDNLVNMGVQIVPLTMEKYAHDQDGWWHELLYEIIHGHRSNSSALQKAELFKSWKAAYDVGLSS